MICRRLPLQHLHHVVPSDQVTKHELLRLIARGFGRPDLLIEQTDAPTAADRTLATVDDGRNREIWAAAGYDEPPTT